jgi:hypothetical protein
LVSCVASPPFVRLRTLLTVERVSPTSLCQERCVPGEVCAAHPPTASCFASALVRPGVLSWYSLHSASFSACDKEECRDFPECRCCRRYLLVTQSLNHSRTDGYAENGTTRHR